MPITNLAIQRARWNELRNMFRNRSNIVSIKPLAHNKHENFVLTVSRLGYSDTEILHANGWDISGLTSLNGFALVYIYRWNIEKEDEYIRRVSLESGIKSLYQLNNELKKRHIASMEQENKILRQKNTQLEERVENLSLLRALPNAEQDE